MRSAVDQNVIMQCMTAMGKLLEEDTTIEAVCSQDELPYCKHYDIMKNRDKITKCGGKLTL